MTSPKSDSPVPYKIIRGFEMPPSRAGRGTRAELYPFSRLEVGETMIFTFANKKSRNSIRACATTYGDKAGKRFTTRTLSDSEIAVQRLPDNSPKAEYNKRLEGAPKGAEQPSPPRVGGSFFEALKDLPTNVRPKS